MTAADVAAALGVALSLAYPTGGNACHAASTNALHVRMDCLMRRAMRTRYGRCGQRIPAS